MISLLAPAKVNLGLRILNRRDDGYHDILSLVQKVDLADRISIRTDPESSGITISCTDPDLPVDAGNLAYRAAELFLAEGAFGPVGVEINLEKNIPHGAGLGGGSSDAAAVLMGMANLLDPAMERGRLLRMAARLGSDVPLFLHPSPAVIRGRGEIVEPSSLMLDASLVIVYPGFSVSTAWAYTNFRLTKSSEKYNISELYRAERGELTPANWREILVNDLEQVVVDHHPEIGACKDLLIQQGAWAALMSGSGSAAFGLFDDRDKAIQAALIIGKKGGYRAFAALPIFS